MATRLETALTRLEAAVVALENRSPVPSTTASVQGEINAIRELVDKALVILAEEENSEGDAGGQLP